MRHAADRTEPIALPRAQVEAEAAQFNVVVGKRARDAATDHRMRRRTTCPRCVTQVAAGLQSRRRTPSRTNKRVLEALVTSDVQARSRRESLTQIVELQVPELVQAAPSLC